MLNIIITNQLRNFFSRIILSKWKCLLEQQHFPFAELLIQFLEGKACLNFYQQAHEDFVCKNYAGNLQSSSIIPSSISRPIFKTNAISNLEIPD